MMCDNFGREWRSRRPAHPSIEVIMMGFRSTVEDLMLYGWKVEIEKNHFTQREYLVITRPEKRLIGKGWFDRTRNLGVISNLVNRKIASRVFGEIVRVDRHPMVIDDLTVEDALKAISYIMGDKKPARRLNPANVEELIRAKVA